MTLFAIIIFDNALETYMAYNSTRLNVSDVAQMAQSIGGTLYGIVSRVQVPQRALKEAYGQ